MKNNKLLTFLLIIALPFTGTLRAEPSVKETAPEELDTRSEIEISPKRFYGEEAPRTLPPPAAELDVTPTDADSEPPKEEVIRDGEDQFDPDQEGLTTKERPPREVGEAATAGMDTAKRKQLGNLAIAVITIAVATTAVLLVSRHEGKHK